ncbi:MAG: hypothetical protein HKN23_03360 [Verrucomicrobiales bacterium]|nr:hypothetical protein [Verrucomicrobiales bacterium]
MIRFSLFFSAFLFLLTGNRAAAQKDFVWVEAENAVEKKVNRNGWYEGLKRGDFSGENLVAHWGNTPGIAKFRVNLPKTDTYTFWLRANPVKSSLNVRFDSGQWFNVNFQRALREETINVAEDNAPDLRFIGWVRAGVQKFDVGEHEIEVRFNSNNNNHGILDCFCLTTDNNWKPRRLLKPGEAAPHWPAPEITEANLDEWMTFLRPSDEELGWRKVRWHHDLSEAAAEAKRLQRPILLWAMNGHPCGET